MIQLNAIHCPKCHDVVGSFNDHDSKTCKCTTQTIGGGLRKLIRTGEHYVELSLDDEMTDDVLAEREVLMSDIITGFVNELPQMNIKHPDFSDQVYKILMLDKGLTIIKKIYAKKIQKSDGKEQGSKDVKTDK